MNQDKDLIIRGLQQEVSRLRSELSDFILRESLAGAQATQVAPASPPPASPHADPAPLSLTASSVLSSWTQTSAAEKNTTTSFTQHSRGCLVDSDQQTSTPSSFSTWTQTIMAKAAVVHRAVQAEVRASKAKTVDRAVDSAFDDTARMAALEEEVREVSDVARGLRQDLEEAKTRELELRTLGAEIRSLGSLVQEQSKALSSAAQREAQAAARSEALVAQLMAVVTELREETRRGGVPAAAVPAPAAAVPAPAAAAPAPAAAAPAPAAESSKIAAMPAPAAVTVPFTPHAPASNPSAAAPAIDEMPPVVRVIVSNAGKPSPFEGAKHSSQTLLAMARERAARADLAADAAHIATPTKPNFVPASQSPPEATSAAALGAAPSTPSAASARAGSVVLVLSGFSDQATKEGLTLMAQQLGCKVGTEIETGVTTHLVCPPGTSTLKIYAAVLQHIWIMHPKWLEASSARGALLPEGSDPEFGRRFMDSPFLGKSFFLSPQFKEEAQAINADRVKGTRNLIRAFGGGRLEPRMPQLFTEVDYYLASSTERSRLLMEGRDPHRVLDWAAFLRLLPDTSKTVQSPTQPQGQLRGQGQPLQPEPSNSNPNVLTADSDVCHGQGMLPEVAKQVGPVSGKKDAKRKLSVHFPDDCVTLEKKARRVF